MGFLIWIGLALTLLGLGGLGWCMRQAMQIRKTALPPAEAKNALQRVIVVNMGSMAFAFLGLALVVVGAVLG